METMARDRARLIADIEAFEPFNEQESVDKQVILRALKSDPNCFERSAQAHMATSIWTVDASFERTLLEWHNIYQSWSWIGGHADGVAVSGPVTAAMAEWWQILPWQQDTAISVSWMMHTDRNLMRACLKATLL